MSSLGVTLTRLNLDIQIASLLPMIHTMECAPAGCTLHCISQQPMIIERGLIQRNFEIAILKIWKALISDKFLDNGIQSSYSVFHETIACPPLLVNAE